MGLGGILEGDNGSAGSSAARARYCLMVLGGAMAGCRVLRLRLRVGAII